MAKTSTIPEERKKIGKKPTSKGENQEEKKQN